MKLLYSIFITYVIAFDNLLYEFSKNPEKKIPYGYFFHFICSRTHRK